MVMESPTPAKDKSSKGTAKPSNTPIRQTPSERPVTDSPAQLPETPRAKVERPHKPDHDEARNCDNRDSGTGPGDIYALGAHHLHVVSNELFIPSSKNRAQKVMMGVPPFSHLQQAS
jgi:hypothetical protein